MPDMYQHLKAEVAERRKAAGLVPSALLRLPPDLAEPLQAMIREGALTCDELADRLGKAPGLMQETLDQLVQQGLAGAEIIDGTTRYHAQLAHRATKARPSGLWLSLVDKLSK